MRIGILTLPPHTNYGGILQAYALQTILERMGHEVRIIYSPRSHALPLFRIPFAYSKRIFRKYVLGKKIAINQERINRQNKLTLQTYTRSFVNEYLHLKHYPCLEHVKENDFDAIVVGSDQIWRSRYIKALITDKVENAFLYFTNGWNIKRIAYAASFGIDSWEYTRRQTCKCKKGISLFNAISVRELSGEALCREKLNVEAQIVLDPTLLLSKNDYINLIKDSSYKIDGEIMSYVLDENENIHNITDLLSRKTGWHYFRSNKQVNDKSIPVQERIQPPVENFLVGFRDARFVITDSFHACVFSIIFNKPFLVIGNVERGMSRFFSLLKVFGLEKRLVQDTENFRLDDWCFENPNVDLDKFRESSVLFLEKSLA